MPFGSIGSSGGAVGPTGMIITAPQTFGIAPTTTLVKSLGVWEGQTIQLPATSEKWTVDQIRIETHTATVTNSVLAVFHVNADPPTLTTQMKLGAITEQFANGAAQIHTLDTIFSDWFNKDEFVHIALNTSAAGLSVDFNSTLSGNSFFSQGFTTTFPFTSAPSWSSYTGRVTPQMICRGFS